MQAILALLPIILPYGEKAVAALIQMFTKSTPPTTDDWQALIALTQKTARQQMMETLAAHGIDPTSPQGVAFLALMPA